jgi:hypothetical protein
MRQTSFSRHFPFSASRELFMRRLFFPLVFCGCLTAVSAGEPVIDGATAVLWSRCTGWTTTPATECSVTNENGSLVFAAQGAGREMPWIINLDQLAAGGDARYLIVQYRAEHVATRPGVYFLHGEEGTRGGMAYAMADDLKPDGQWHALAVDLLALDPLETTHQLALKLVVDTSGPARMEVNKLWFTDDMPADAQLARVPSQLRQQRTTIDWSTSALLPREGWTTTPATDYRATLNGKEVTFHVRDAGKGMRWIVALPAPVDLAHTPYISVRYKAAGAIAPTGYTVWLGNQEGGADGNAVIALLPTNLAADGAWHLVSVRLEKAFVATHLAIGLDSAGDDANLTLDSVQFSSRPPRWSLAAMLPHETRAVAWPVGQDNFTAEAISVHGGTGSSFLAHRLGLSDWFTASYIGVNGVPFTVPVDPAKVMQSGTAQCGELSLALPADVREVYLLTAAAAPPTEPWGIDSVHPRPVEMLDVPEKLIFEIRYEAGPPDLVLPLDAQTGTWRMRRGLGVTVVHPDALRKPTELVLRDRMQTASFAIVAATMLRGNPRVTEADWKHLAYSAPPTHALSQSPASADSSPDAVRSGVLKASFESAQGLRCRQLAVAGLDQALTCASAPLFEVITGGRLLAAEDWSVVKTERLSAGMRFLVRHPVAQLAATIECVPDAANELLLRMTLVNESDRPLTATLRFPILQGICLGNAADTWYLSGKRGGIINFADTAQSDPLGERHPLQMDGFFNPRIGLALALLTHDTAAQHHFIHLAKSRAGGKWAIEYPDRDLAAGSMFVATEAAVVLREGDWRAILDAHKEWLASWFQPVAPRKPWFERIFALSSGNAHYDASSDPRTRGDVQRLVNTMQKYIGPCDYVHLFGWGASQQYGDWGDYSHYEEVGGLEYFRANVQRAQQQGRAVSLYLDGYLSSERGENVGAHAKDWAMRHPDGSPQFVAEYRAYNECPYQEGWRKCLSDTYARVQREVGPQIMYIDEIGATDGRWTCWAKDHGHSAHEIPYAGEVALLRDIREAVGQDTILYTEYPPAEVSRQYIDGSITYQALWSVDQEPLAPHFIDLPRFVFPDFKQLHIIYYVGTRAGNWWLLKFPFFNGEVYRNGEPNLPGMDAASLAFLKRAIQVQCAHRDAFASHDVEPLVCTEVPGVFANRFSTANETVWTLYNANGRSVHAPVLSVPHVTGATYEDAWSGDALMPETTGDRAAVTVCLGPKAVGCIVQKRPPDK